MEYISTKTELYPLLQLSGAVIYPPGTECVCLHRIAYLLPAGESTIFMELVRSDQERLKIVCDKMVEMGLPDVEEIK